jgi:hypothetical protein
MQLISNFEIRYAIGQISKTVWNYRPIGQEISSAEFGFMTSGQLTLL